MGPCFSPPGVEELLARLRLTEEPLVRAVTALDDHSEEDERPEAPPRRHFSDEAGGRVRRTGDAGHAGAQGFGRPAPPRSIGSAHRGGLARVASPFPGRLTGV